MSKRNTVFLNKYNELDNLCRHKFKMFRTPNGERNNLSAIKEYAYKLPEMYREKLLNLIKLRNIIAHSDAAEASEQSIKDLDAFILMVKKNSVPKNPDSFEVASYVSHNVKRFEEEIRELDIDDEDISFAAKKKIKDELYDFVKSLKAAKNIAEAKRIVRDFYTYIEDVDEHPLILQEELEDYKRESMLSLTESFNDVMDERKNPFVRSKAKDIYNRYRDLINRCKDEESIDDLLERGNDCLSDLLYK